MDNNDPNQRPITVLLHDWQRGDRDAFDRLMEFVYSDLRRRAAAYLKHERAGHTLGTTDLVNEAFIRLVEKGDVEWIDRNHFFAIAAQAMRRILVDYARTRNREKRGGKGDDLRIEDLHDISGTEAKVDLEALDEALSELAAFDKRQASVVELKYFGGLTLDETATVLGVSRVTVTRDWTVAKAWLRNRLS